MVFMKTDLVKVLELENHISVTWSTVPGMAIMEQPVTEERKKKISNHAVYTFDPWDPKYAIEYAIEKQLDYSWLIDWRDKVCDEWYRKFLLKKFWETLDGR
jgi:hypothetical protein